ncbi:magnesium-dependent phosphatase-1 [Exidia glandulosa HHB12029]|uniref:Magnesium-dependent phosphatase-1 n=1 Tax=Exidia glandulosa HHB12029 TaxID=1314781 RepID=A0A165PRY0_EXIGL|nr:magnesium-dependent phosphatase-1 [Exidia glandulosa HHB12029]
MTDADAGTAEAGASERHPRLICFDLDYTLWPLWIDTHVSPPFSRDGDTHNEVKDSSGSTIRFYKDVPAIFARLSAQPQTQVAACSRTHAPGDARDALDLLLIRDHEGETKPARHFFHHEEIYPGSKMQHFRALHKKTGIPYKEMLFFDDEYRNNEVSSLGVTFVLVKRGLDEETFQKGLAKWRSRQGDS